MSRPITLFTGQWADLPFDEVARLAGEWGYDGLEIACWGDHLDVSRWDDAAYVRSRREILDRNGLQVHAIRSTSVTATSCPTGCGATVMPRASDAVPPRG